MIKIECRDGYSLHTKIFTIEDDSKVDITKSISSIDIRMRPDEYISAKIECYIDSLDINILSEMIKITPIMKEDGKTVEITIAEYKEILKRRQKNKYNFWGKELWKEKFV